MTPLIQSRFLPDEVELFERIRQLVWALPDIDLGKDQVGVNMTLSCHILARAVGNVFSLKVEDGRFAHVASHSWLVLPSRHIIDVYPVGILGGPLLVYGGNSGRGSLAPAKWLYQVTGADFVSDYLPAFTFESPCFITAVERVTEEIRQVHARLMM